MVYIIATKLTVYIFNLSSPSTSSPPASNIQRSGAPPAPKSNLRTPHLQTLDAPIGVYERPWVVRDIILARRGGRAKPTTVSALFRGKKKEVRGRYSPSGISPHGASPIATEGIINHYPMALELFIDVAISLEQRGRHPPVCWLRVSVERIVRDTPAREEPDLDEPRRPLHGVHAAFHRVELFPVGIRARVLGTAALVRVLPRRIDVAVTSDWERELPLPIDSAAVVSVQRHYVPRLLVHAFDDVDLAAVWPVVAECPTVRSVSTRIKGRERGGGGGRGYNAGHVPQIPPGMWETSSKNRPRWNLALLSSRTLERPDGATFV